MLQSSEMRELLNFVRHDLAERLKDPAFLTGFANVRSIESKHPELYVCQFFDHIGSHVRAGLTLRDERNRNSQS